jgi:hypothetical protein
VISGNFCNKRILGFFEINNLIDFAIGALIEEFDEYKSMTDDLSN